MTQFGPQGDAPRFQPDVEIVQAGKGRRAVPEPMPGILYILLDLALLPSRCGIAELSIEHVVIDHDLEALVYVPGLALSDLVDGGLHVVVDAASGHAAQHNKGMVVGVEQHFVGLQRVGAQQEGAAVRELELGDLQLGAFAADDRPVFTPVELDGVAGVEGVVTGSFRRY